MRQIASDAVQRMKYTVSAAAPRHRPTTHLYHMPCNERNAVSFRRAINDRPYGESANRIRYRATNEMHRFGGGVDMPPHTRRAGACSRRRFPNDTPHRFGGMDHICQGKYALPYRGDVKSYLSVRAWGGGLILRGSTEEVKTTGRPQVRTTGGIRRTAEPKVRNRVPLLPLF